MLIRALLGEISFNKSQFILCRQLIEALRYKLEGRGLYSGPTIYLESTSSLKIMNTGESCGGKRRPMHRADNLATFMFRLSRSYGSRKCLSRPVKG
jgi:hypothetical protein